MIPRNDFHAILKARREKRRKARELAALADLAAAHPEEFEELLRRRLWVARDPRLQETFETAGAESGETPDA
jgi:hypothetical protein